MKIDEAVKQAIETSGRIRRKSAVASPKHAEIIPTNSYDACTLIVVSEDKTEKTYRCWNPTADDLMADDWEVLTQKARR